MEQTMLSRIVEMSRPYAAEGKTADYIPILRQADPSRLGIAVMEKDGRLVKAGDADIRFSIQSISKIITFTLSLMDSGIDRVFQTVSVEPTDDAFNSVINLETKNNHRPLNPMINAGSIACLTLVDGASFEIKQGRILDLTRKLAANSAINVGNDIYLSEKSTASRNRALTYYMQSTGVIEGDVEDILDAYFKACSMLVDCADLARIALVYALGGIDPVSGERLFSSRIAHIVKAAMAICGMYDESGWVAVNIGLPTKSGVGGGLLAVSPNRLGIGIYGPALNHKGSSTAGLAALTCLSRELDLSIY